MPCFNDACKQAVLKKRKKAQQLFHYPTAELAFKQLKAKARHNALFIRQKKKKKRGEKVSLFFNSLKS